MDASLLFWTVLVCPLLFGTVCQFVPSPRRVLDLTAVGVVLASTAAVGLGARAALGQVQTAGAGWLFVDALSGCHLVLMGAVFSVSSLYARRYFAPEIDSGLLSASQARRFSILWFGSFTAMGLVLLSDNLGLMWVGMETTTLLTAFLICLHRNPRSMEAMWRYLLICSVGIAFAFMGTLLTAAAAAPLHLPPAFSLRWTALSRVAAGMDAVMLKTAFIFLLVGYGTKAGLAPMHYWLPDAHSQAPAPVSAIFSGFMLNAAFYCLLRYVPLVESATGHAGWSHGLLVFIGVLSILTAAVFIIFQHDLKRFLAYCSIEHMGIIALGIGLGGAGVIAGLFHAWNHSLCKTLTFLSAGSLGQVYGTHDMDRMRGVLRRSPWWGRGLIAGLMALIGLAPFALFMSEFQIVRAAVDRSSWWALAAFLAGAVVVFIGALRRAISMAWDDGTGEAAVVPAGFSEKAIVAVLVSVLLFFGLWMPRTFWTALQNAAAVVKGGP